MSNRLAVIFSPPWCSQQRPSLLALLAAAAAMKPAGGKKAGAPLIKDASATAATNLTVLRRTDADVEEVLGTAGHVCLYGFDVDTKQWARAAPRARGGCVLGAFAVCTTHADALRSRSAEPQGSGGLHVRGQAVRPPPRPRASALRLARCSATRAVVLSCSRASALRLTRRSPAPAARRRASSSSS